MVAREDENTWVPEAVRKPGDHTDQSHEHVVKEVRDITRGGKKVVFEINPGGGVDTGLRRLIPVTYDIDLDHAEVRETGEDK
ncbi:hypothetical protein ACFQ08_17120 [Streptosporangium algeriense]|uniref:Uncharacterized protein n=1 Tax=Streptosporangium algeriense TaxID=1682748 RepID=A0ABW3DR20_9ACTN